MVSRNSFGGCMYALHLALACSIERRQMVCQTHYRIPGGQPGEAFWCHSQRLDGWQTSQDRRAAHRVGRPSVTRMMTRGLDLSAPASRARQRSSPAEVKVPCRFCFAAFTCAHISRSHC